MLSCAIDHVTTPRAARPGTPPSRRSTSSPSSSSPPWPTSKSRYQAMTTSTAATGLEATQRRRAETDLLSSTGLMAGPRSSIDLGRVPRHVLPGATDGAPLVAQVRPAGRRGRSTSARARRLPLRPGPWRPAGRRPPRPAGCRPGRRRAAAPVSVADAADEGASAPPHATRAPDGRPAGSSTTWRPRARRVESEADDARCRWTARPRTGCGRGEAGSRLTSYLPGGDGAAVDGAQVEGGRQRVAHLDLPFERRGDRLLDGHGGRRRRSWNDWPEALQEPAAVPEAVSAPAVLSTIQRRARQEPPMRSNSGSSAGRSDR